MTVEVQAGSRDNRGAAGTVAYMESDIENEVHP
jgi:hypothetical protein